MRVRARDSREGAEQMCKGAIRSSLRGSNAIECTQPILAATFATSSSSQAQAGSLHWAALESYRPLQSRTSPPPPVRTA